MPKKIYKNIVSTKIEDIVREANPLRGTPEGKNNCGSCALASFGRTLGLDLKAKSFGGEAKNLNGLVEECFKGARTIDGSAATFGKSPEAAKAMLVRKFGDNASGAVSVPMGNGHIFNFRIENGVCEFFDGQNGCLDGQVAKYWRAIDRNGSLQIARLDDAEPIPEKLLQYVEGSLDEFAKLKRVA